MTPTASPAPFYLQARQLQAGLHRDGIAFADMRRAQPLEKEFAGQVEPSPGRRPSPRGEVRYLEGDFRARPVPIVSGPASRVGYFLDGTQRTLPFSRFGMVPTAVGMSAVGVVEREPGGPCAIALGSIAQRNVWMIPQVDGVAETKELADRLRALGEDVVDPLVDNDVETSGDYSLHLQAIYSSCLLAREQIEQEALLSFWDQDRQFQRDRWIAIDGRLTTPLPRAIGLVKQFSNTYLSAADASILLSLQPGERSSAFQPVVRSSTEPRTLWYLRLWSADGQDARHGLMRLETHGSVVDTEEVDQISSWILAERTPRATGDSRWATLLYPIHILERSLKRLLDAETRGWTTR